MGSEWGWEEGGRGHCHLSGAEDIREAQQSGPKTEGYLPTPPPGVGQTSASTKAGDRGHRTGQEEPGN